MLTNYLLDETENPFCLTQKVPTVYFAQGIISGNIANVNYSRMQSVGDQLCKFSKNVFVAPKF